MNSTGPDAFLFSSCLEDITSLKILLFFNGNLFVYISYCFLNNFYFYKSMYLLGFHIYLHNFEKGSPYV